MHAEEEEAIKTCVMLRKVEGRKMVWKEEEVQSKAEEKEQ
jgi:hypothetical protein